MSKDFTIQFKKSDYIDLTTEEIRFFELSQYFEDYREYKIDQGDLTFSWVVIDDYDGPVNLDDPILIVSEDFYLLAKHFFEDHLGESYEEWKIGIIDDEIEAQLERETAAFKAKRMRELKTNE